MVISVSSAQHIMLQQYGRQKSISDSSNDQCSHYGENIKLEGYIQGIVLFNSKLKMRDSMLNFQSLHLTDFMETLTKAEY